MKGGADRIMRRLVCVLASILLFVHFCAGALTASQEPVNLGLSERAAAQDAPLGRVLSTATVNAIPPRALFSLKLAVPTSSIPIDLSCEGCGPCSFSVGRDGSIAILDSLNKSIKVYDQSGLREELHIPGAVYPIMLEQNSAAWFILDSSGLFIRISKKSDKVWTRNVPGCFGSIVLMSHVGECIYCCDCSYNRFVLEGEFPEEFPCLTPYLEPPKDPRFSSDVSRYVGRDDSGNSYFIRYTFVQSSLVLGELVLCRYNTLGEPTGYAVLNTEEYDFIPTDGISVCEDGSIYVLACIDGAVDAFSVTLGENFVSHIEQLKLRADLLLSGLDVPDRALCSDTILYTCIDISPIPMLIRSASIYLDALLYQRDFVPCSYVNPSCKLFFRVILQAPG